MQGIGRRLANFLTRPAAAHLPVRGLEHHWRDLVRPGDVLLVEGTSRISVAIKYLTQSTWSHAALVVGDGPVGPLIEADVANGVVASPYEKYDGSNVRVCRPIGLSASEVERVVGFAVDHVGLPYDLKNIVDLARYLFPTPPVPTAFRRRMLTLGSGDPTRKLICSALIARAFQSIRYPILPIQWWEDDGSSEHREIVSQVRHYSLFVPRDFDLSPYFDIVKPTVEARFDFRVMRWSPDDSPDDVASNTLR